MNHDPPSAGADDRTRADQVLGGRYRLISQVGAGGMAVVWQAYDTVLARTVAVKVLAAHSTGDPLSRDRIRREARAAAALSHPNIAQVYDYGETSLMPYVVMELVRGGTLHQRLRDGAVLPRYAMRVCAEIAAALAAAHAEGLVHRDIKPANVMLAPTGAKVVDFGIAAAIRPPSGGGADDFEVLGTPAYLAPERLLHDAVEPASDVYALGVLLYRLLAGHSPWTTESTTQMLKAHIYLEPAPLLPMFQVPGPVTDLCNRCLAKDPAQRPSAREAATLLAHAAGLQVITDEAPAQAQPGTESATEPEPSVLIRAAGAAAHLEDDAAAAADHRADEAAAAVDHRADEAAAAVVHRDDADLPGAGGQAPGTDRRNPKRAVYALSAVVLLVALAATLWFLRPDPREAAVSAAPPSAPGLAPGPSRTAAKPLVSAPSAPAGTAPAGPATSPAVVAGATVTAPPPGATAPGATVPGATAPGATTPGVPPVAAPAATTPAVTPATSAAEPAPTTTPPAAEPSERTLSSAAGSVRATCPAAGTAQILSWTATKPYKVARGDKEAGPAPSVSFTHGNTQVIMTVTCDDGVPSAAST